VANYENVLIFSPEIPIEQIDQILSKIQGIVEQQGGTISSTDKWGRRRTAYALKKFREVFYVVVRFVCEKSKVGEIEKFCKINASILRHLIINLDQARLAVQAIAEPKKEIKPEEVTVHEQHPETTGTK
jgi:small subunit ribosomal protein S6